MKQRFPAPANIVNEFEEAQVPGQLLLRDTMVGLNQERNAPQASLFDVNSAPKP